MHLLLAVTLSILIPFGHTTQATVTLKAASSISPSVRESSAPTCPFRMINYITHTLPQQCLRTSRDINGTTFASNSQASTGSDVTEGVLGETQSQDGEHQIGSTSSSNFAQDSPTTTITVSLSVPSIQSTSNDPSTTDSTTDSIHLNDSDSQLDLSTESPEPEVDLDPSLDNSNFLSFEDWKKQNLAKAGQSSENIGNRRTGDGGSEGRRRPGTINNALESLGEDGEIDLDFGDFVSPSRGDQHHGPASAWSDQVSDHVESQDNSQGRDSGTDPPSSQRANQRDAGTTYAERFNYASFDCAATVLKTSLESKGSSSILVENKDSYMLTACSVANKFLIVELCNDILVDTVVLANYEFFSSMFRSFRISVSGTYPAKLDRWKELGVFEARNSREVQPFKVENPLIWARYLRVEFLTHFGNEYYCPVSLLRVHGTTMMEEFKNQGDAARAYDEVDENEVESEKGESAPIDEKSPPATETGQTEEDHKPVYSEQTPAEASTGAEQMMRDELSEDEPRVKDRIEQADESSGGLTRYSFSARHQLEMALFLASSSSLPVCTRVQSMNQTTSTQSAVNQVNDTVAYSQEPQLQENGSKMERSTDTDQLKQPNALYEQNSAANERTSTTNPSSTIPVHQKAASQNASDVHKSMPSATSALPANPTTQESFFKTIHKRLQLLEANSSLSLQYIEEQSRILRDAFVKVEKKQTSKAAAFLEQLNSTVLTELRGFRIQYDQIWQSTVLELESQRERVDSELLAVSSRLTLLADEIIFQKRLSIVQSLLLLLCLVFVIFSRSSAATSSYLELPLIQNILARSQSTLRMPFESPPASPISSRPNSSSYNRRPLSFTNYHRHQRSDSSYDDTNPHQREEEPRSPLIDLSPPTPTETETGISGPSPERQLGKERRPSTPSNHNTSPTPEDSFGSRGLPPQPNTGTQSSPATPSGTRRPRKNPLSWHEHDFIDSSLLRPEHAKDRPRGAGRRSPLSMNEDSRLGFPATEDNEDESNQLYDGEEEVHPAATATSADTEARQGPGKKPFPTPPPENGRPF